MSTLELLTLKLAHIVWIMLSDGVDISVLPLLDR